MRVLLLCLVLFIPLTSYAIVDMKSANYSESWTDLIVPGVGYDCVSTEPTIAARYSTACSALAGVRIMKPKSTSLPKVICASPSAAAASEITFTTKNFNPVKIDSTVKSIIEEVKQPPAGFKGRLFGQSWKRN